MNKSDLTICYQWQNDKMVFYECEIKKDTPIKIISEIKKAIDKVYSSTKDPLKLDIDDFFNN
jgi:hypothetical protein